MNLFRTGRSKCLKPFHDFHWWQTSIFLRCCTRNAVLAPLWSSINLDYRYVSLYCSVYETIFRKTIIDDSTLQYNISSLLEKFYDKYFRRLLQNFSLFGGLILRIVSKLFNRFYDYRKRYLSSRTERIYDESILAPVSFLFIYSSDHICQEINLEMMIKGGIFYYVITYFFETAILQRIYYFIYIGYIKKFIRKDRGEMASVECPIRSTTKFTISKQRSKIQARWETHWTNELTCIFLSKIFTWEFLLFSGIAAEVAIISGETRLSRRPRSQVHLQNYKHTTHAHEKLQHFQSCNSMKPTIRWCMQRNIPAWNRAYNSV